MFLGIKINTLKMIGIKSNVGNVYKVDINIIKTQSSVIRDMLESDDYCEISIPFDDSVISKIINFCNSEVELYDDSIFDDSIFDDSIFDDSIFELLRISDFLGMDILVDICCLKISSLIQDKNTDELEKYFNVSDHVTAEENLEFKSSNIWNYPPRG